MTDRMEKIIAAGEADHEAIRLQERAAVVAWLRQAIRATKLDVADGLWVGISEDAESFINTLRIIIDAIESGKHWGGAR